MIQPGDRIAVERGGILYTDYVTAVSYTSAKYKPAPKLSRWQRITRALTPRRLRKPLPQPARQAPQISITLGDDRQRDAIGRAALQIESIGTFISGLIGEGEA